HVVSSQNCNVQAQMRARARSIKFAWSQKYEVGGAYGTDGSQNTSIAKQSLPGVGSMNPDKSGAENGGWYTLLFNTPISSDIQAQQPHITKQPGPGVNNDSMRDLRVGFDLIDTISTGSNAKLETGLFTVDRIEIRKYDLVGD